MTDTSLAANASGLGNQTLNADALLAPIDDVLLPGLLKLAAIQPGERVLILRAGPSDCVSTCAERAAPDGEVLVLDVANAAGGVRTESVPLQQVSVREGEIAALLPQLGDSYWDVAICHLGLSSLADPAWVLQEFHRVLRPVGRIALSAWGLPDRVRWIGFLLDVLARNGFGPRSPATLPFFVYSAPGSLSRALAEAGYEDVTPERVREDACFDSVEQYWQTLMAGEPTAGLILRLQPGERGMVRAGLERLVRPYTRRDGRLLLPMETLNVAGVK